MKMKVLLITELHLLGLQMTTSGLRVSMLSRSVRVTITVLQPTANRSRFLTRKLPSTQYLTHLPLICTYRSYGSKASLMNCSKRSISLMKLKMVLSLLLAKNDSPNSTSNSIRANYKSFLMTMLLTFQLVETDLFASFVSSPSMPPSTLLACQSISGTMSLIDGAFLKTTLNTLMVNHL